MERRLTCEKCKSPLDFSKFSQTDASLLNSGEVFPCPACGARLIVEIYPAMFRAPGAGRSASAVISSGDAGCFYHPQKKAEVPCESCGRFLCALCDVELNGSHLCPNCLQSGRKKGRFQNLENERVLYDHMSLVFATLPLLLWPFTLVTAPIALFLAIRYWNSPSSLVPRWTRFRFVLAILLSLAQIIGWLLLFGFLLKRVIKI